MSLDTLAALNMQLIRSAIAPQVEGAEPDALDEFFGSTQPVVPPEDEPAGPGTWSTAMPFEYRQTIDWLKSNAFAGDVPTGMSTFITAFAAQWGLKAFEESGGTEGGGAWPTLNELLEQPEFVNGATWLPFIQARLPPVFTTEDEEGTQFIATADPLTGVTFEEVQVFTPPPPTPFEEQILRGDMTAPAPAMFQTTRPGGRSGGGPPTQRTIAEVLKENPELKTAAQWKLDERTNAPSGAPHLTAQELTDRLAATQPERSGGGRGGGSSTRRDLVFDRNHLLDQADSLYRSWMLEDADEAEISRIVDDYVREASSFWSKEGGQLDFDTHVRGQLKALPQFKMRFRKMPSHLEPEQYLARFAQPIAGLGLRAETTEAETIAALESGGSPTEQLRRVSRTREAQHARPFSQELAQTVAGLGPAVRF